jgi:hypothetical protein
LVSLFFKCSYKKTAPPGWGWELKSSWNIYYLWLFFFWLICRTALIDTCMCNRTYFTRDKHNQIL